MALCLYIPSTARTMEPSGPRKAKPVPITVMQVVMATHLRLATSLRCDESGEWPDDWPGDSWSELREKNCYSWWYWKGEKKDSEVFWETRHWSNIQGTWWPRKCSTRLEVQSVLPLACGTPQPWQPLVRKPNSLQQLIPSHDPTDFCGLEEPIQCCKTINQILLTRDKIRRVSCKVNFRNVFVHGYYIHCERSARLLLMRFWFGIHLPLFQRFQVASKPGYLNPSPPRNGKTCKHRCLGANCIKVALRTDSKSHPGNSPLLASQLLQQPNVFKTFYVQYVQVIEME